jgi:hypothetical protein
VLKGWPRVVVGLVALFGAAIGGWWAVEGNASRRAVRARDALHVGATCADLVLVAEQFANERSVKEVREACSTPSARVLTLNFSNWISLNYLLSIEISRDGQVVAISRVGAW